MDVFVGVDVYDEGHLLADADQLCRGDFDLPVKALYARGAVGHVDVVIPLWDADGVVDCGELVVSYTVQRRPWSRAAATE